MAPAVTEIVNNTQQALNMKVGNHHYFVDFAKIGKGEKHSMQVDYNDTYQEFLMGCDRTGKKLIVTSDDCCDYKCITITEVDGKFDVKRVPRTNFRATEETKAAAPIAKKPCHGHSSSWRTMLKFRS
ncbi:hypothetical protein M758_6G022100 [Ceratodon purpureus]|nr:hypothetical protein M758_6G022100 [Ceratodon purpureus]